MRTPSRSRLPALQASSLLVAASLLGGAGCSTTGAERAVAASESMDKFNVDTAKVKDGIDAALASLQSLVGSSGASVKPSFDAFTKSLTALEAQAEVVRTEAEAMKARGDEYFASWVPEESSISPDRHAQLQTAYDGIASELTLAKEAFSPFLSALKDVQGYLSLDLSAKGLEGAGPLADAAVAKGADVKERIEGVLRQVNAVRGMLSASLEGGAAPPF